MSMESTDLEVDHVALAFTIITETNEDILGTPTNQEEMRFVGGAIMNRVRNEYRGERVLEVVLKSKQYSRFNGSPPERLALESAEPALAVMDVIAQYPKRYSEELYRQALLIAAEMVENDGGNPWRNGVIEHAGAPRVHHYYSPISMKPPGSQPPWWRDDREIVVPGIDPNRFRWGWGIA